MGKSKLLNQPPTIRRLRRRRTAERAPRFVPNFQSACLFGTIFTLCYLMGRRSTPSLALAATVRVWFGLTQTELARALGTSRTLVAKYEAGIRRLPRAADERLYQLAMLGPGVGDRPTPPPLALTPLLAPAEEAPVPAPPEALTAAEQQDVRRRLARLEREAYRLRVAFDEAHPRQVLLTARWAAALPALQAAATTVPPADPPPPEVWLAAYAARLAVAPRPHNPGSPLDVARQALRLHLLTREIGQLRAWLAADPKK